MFTQTILHMGAEKITVKIERAALGQSNIHRSMVQFLELEVLVVQEKSMVHITTINIICLIKIIRTHQVYILAEGTQ